MHRPGRIASPPIPRLRDSAGRSPIRSNRIGAPEQADAHVLLLASADLACRSPRISLRRLASRRLTREPDRLGNRSPISDPSRTHPKVRVIGSRTTVRSDFAIFNRFSASSISSIPIDRSNRRGLASRGWVCCRDRCRNDVVQIAVPRVKREKSEINFAFRSGLNVTRYRIATGKSCLACRTRNLNFS